MTGVTKFLLKGTKQIYYNEEKLVYSQQYLLCMILNIFKVYIHFKKMVLLHKKMNHEL